MTFVEDPGYWHERLILYPATLHSYAIMSPHGDEYVEHEGWWSTVTVMTGRETYPPEMVGEVVQFEAPVEVGELLTAVRRGRNLAHQERRASPALGVPASPTGALTWAGTVVPIPDQGVGDLFLRMRTKAPDARRNPAEAPPLRPPGGSPPLLPFAGGKGAAPRPGPHDGDADDGPAIDLGVGLDLSAGADWAWQVSESIVGQGGAGYPAFGTTIDLAEGSIIRDQVALAKLANGGWLACRRTRLSDVPFALENLQGFLFPDGPKAPDAPREAKPFDEDGGETLPQEKGAATAADEDVRTLSVTWDEHGERYKPWRDACREMSRHEFPDWGEKFDQAPPSVLALFKNFDRFGGDPGRWRDDWLKELGMSKHERTAIEITVLTRAMLYFATYDQLNCPSLAGVEVLAQRLAQLIDAYSSGDAGKPNFKGVKHFTSEVSSTNVVPVALRSFAHRKAKEENDMDKLRHYATNTHSAATGDGDDDEGGPALGKGARRGKEKGAGAKKPGGKAVLAPPPGGPK